MQTLSSAVQAVTSGRFKSGLDGLPIGGWPETQRAIRQLTDELPLRCERSYTVSDLIAALYHTSGDRYVSRAREAHQRRLERAGDHGVPDIMCGRNRVHLDHECMIVVSGPDGSVSLPDEWLERAQSARRRYVAIERRGW